MIFQLFKALIVIYIAIYMSNLPSFFALKICPVKSYPEQSCEFTLEFFCRLLKLNLTRSQGEIFCPCTVDMAQSVQTKTWLHACDISFPLLPGYWLAWWGRPNRLSSMPWNPNLYACLLQSRCSPRANVLEMRSFLSSPCAMGQNWWWLLI